MSRVLVTGTSVETSRRALELAAARGVEGADGAAGAEGARLFCTAGVHPHEAKGLGLGLGLGLGFGLGLGLVTAARGDSSHFGHEG